MTANVIQTLNYRNHSSKVTLMVVVVGVSDAMTIRFRA
jgi:hypothetical protein